MSVVFTAPGKCGDALHQFPVVHHWAKQSGEQCEIWMDEKTCKPLVPLFEAQPGVSAVKLMGGVENYGCGGQPFHMNLPTSAFEGHTIYHLGLRSFPVRQLTLECLKVSKVPVEVDPDTLAKEPCLTVEPRDSVDLLVDPIYSPVSASRELAAKDLYARPGRFIAVSGPRRLVLHGQSVYAHTNNSPSFWKFIAGVRKELESLFDEIVFVGSERDLEVGARTYPDWKTFDDGGDFLKLASFIAASKAMIGCGSAPIVLAGLLKVPAIRVHDPVGDNAPKVIWSNMAHNNINCTEPELRRTWPHFRNNHLAEGVAVESSGG